MASKRFENRNWTFPVNSEGNITEWEHVSIAVLMDIRDELQKLNRVLACPNFQAMPHQISRVARDVAGLRRDLKKTKSNKKNTK